ncbi:GNAT family N-acetyltransferase [Ligilactobacillus sp.]|uniref:GNAT family N-acetyltransferase n=1 Tax=Ligilactobacillus sp. TaxID=2767921 RepID=UPI002FDF663C
MIEIIESSIESKDAEKLISELNQSLIEITGDDGTSNFNSDDVKEIGTVFLIAYFNGIPYGCGALRKLSDDVAEIKRIYAKTNCVGIGRAIIEKLEEKAVEFGYARILLETRKQNKHAIKFYNRCGYVHCETYGRYRTNDDAYCFEKNLNM